MRTDRRQTQSGAIAHLVADLRPVKAFDVVRLSVVWLIAQLGLVLAVAVAVRRPDLAQAAERPLFQGEILALLLGGFCAGLLAIRAAVPAQEPNAATTAAALALGAIAILLFAGEKTGQATLLQFVDGGWPCSAKTLVLAVLPCVVLMVILRGGAPIAPVRAGLLAGGASLFFAAIALRITCPDDETLHLLVWHGIPVAGGAAVAGLVATRVVDRWWQRA